jgi:hypothetical protein
MNSLIIEPTDDTPRVVLDKENNTFELSGRSLPEDVIEFYAPIFEWYEEYVQNPNDKTMLKVNIDYFNSASQRALNEIMIILSKALANGHDISVEWCFYEEDDEMREVGEEFASLTKLPFTYKALQGDS